MEELFKMGLSIPTMNTVFKLCPGITNEEIQEKSNILDTIDCTNNEKRNIIGSNPLFLRKSKEDILNLINYLKEIGFRSLNDLFSSNPSILNLDTFEVKEYVNNELENGKELDDIVDNLDSNPYLFFDI